MKELLPIGSVVLLEDAEKALMTIGIMQKSNETLYDYIGVIYPEGYINRDTFFVFNHEDIEKILFKGHESQEYKTFLEKVSKEYKE